MTAKVLFYYQTYWNILTKVHCLIAILRYIKYSTYLIKKYATSMQVKYLFCFISSPIFNLTCDSALFFFLLLNPELVFFLLFVSQGHDVMRGGELCCVYCWKNSNPGADPINEICVKRLKNYGMLRQVVQIYKNQSYKTNLGQKTKNALSYVQVCYFNFDNIQIRTWNQLWFNKFCLFEAKFIY